MELINKILAFITVKEFTATLFLLISMFFAITGSWFFSGIFLGVFIQENWKIIKEVVLKLWDKIEIGK